MVTAGLGRTEANPTAGARNGAVQDVASSVVRSPLKKAPAEPCFDASVVAAVSAPEPSVISNTPKRLSAIRQSIFSHHTPIARLQNAQSTNQKYSSANHRTTS